MDNAFDRAPQGGATPKPPALSGRLRAVADAVRRGSRAADVGCDHGKLAAYLVCSGVCESVIATDINPTPLAKARALFESLGIEDRCTAALCDGLDAVEPRSVDDIVISGLGADAIIGIFERTLWLRDKTLRIVLCPSTRHAKLRRALYLRGFELVAERAVCESGFCYSVMTAAYTGSPRDISDGFAAIGLLTDKSEDSARYRAREIRRYERLLRSGADEDKKRRARSALDYLSEVDK